MTLACSNLGKTRSVLYPKSLRPVFDARTTSLFLTVEMPRTCQSLPESPVFWSNEPSVIESPKINECELVQQCVRGETARALDRSTASDISTDGEDKDSFIQIGRYVTKKKNNIVCSSIRSIGSKLQKKVSQKDFSLFIILHKLDNHTNEIASYLVPKHETETRLAIRFFCPLKKRRVLEWLLAALHNSKVNVRKQGNQSLHVTSQTKHAQHHLPPSASTARSPSLILFLHRLHLGSRSLTWHDSQYG